jgi:hypothetical protein
MRRTKHSPKRSGWRLGRTDTVYLMARSLLDSSPKHDGNLPKNRRGDPRAKLLPVIFCDTSTLERACHRSVVEQLQGKSFASDCTGSGSVATIRGGPSLNRSNPRSRTNGQKSVAPLPSTYCYRGGMSRPLLPRVASEERGCYLPCWLSLASRCGLGCAYIRRRARQTQSPIHRLPFPS